jgi:NitT/TauT family transport system substrate-binding protein
MSEMVPLIENNGKAYFEVSGNTDSTGTRAGQHDACRQQRARERGAIIWWRSGSSRASASRSSATAPDRPICNEKNPGEEGIDLDACRSMNRATRLAIFAR